MENKQNKAATVAAWVIVGCVVVLIVALTIKAVQALF